MKKSSLTSTKHTNLLAPFRWNEKRKVRSERGKKSFCFLYAWMMKEHVKSCGKWILCKTDDTTQKVLKCLVHNHHSLSLVTIRCWIKQVVYLVEKLYRYDQYIQQSFICRQQQYVSLVILLWLLIVPSYLLIITYWCTRWLQSNSYAIPIENCLIQNINNNSYQKIQLIKLKT